MKIISFILLLCLALSLYSFIFNNGEILSFEETYKGAMTFVTDTGNIFSKLREGIIATVEFTLGLPEKIGNFFTNFGDIMSEKFTDITDRIGQFFTGLWNNLLKFFNKDTSCECENPAECEDCLCEAEDCLCGMTLDYSSSSSGGGGR